MILLCPSLLAIPKIIEEADFIELDRKKYDGKPIIRFIKTINGRTTVVSYVSQKKHDLGVQTMYSSIKKDSLVTAANAKALTETSETTSNTAIFNTTISQSDSDVNSSIHSKEKNNTKFSITELDSDGNEDIRFSLSEPVEEKDNLIAVHNIYTDKLAKSLKLGGFPMPSIAVTKADMGHENYGECSFVFDKSTIDPKVDKRNKVYGGDAWTPTYPSIDYKVNENVADKARKKYYDLYEQYGEKVRSAQRYLAYLLTACTSCMEHILPLSPHHNHSCSPCFLRSSA